MSAHRQDLSTQDRIRLSTSFLAHPDENRSQLARQALLSRPALYRIANKASSSLHHTFTPHSPPPSLHQEGFWLWIDANSLKRFIVSLRAICGATFSSIIFLIQEIFGILLSDWMVGEVVHESYQRSFDYQESVSLENVKRAAFDEMYRWRRCELVGVDADSLFIFLAEKQPGCSAKQWTQVMERLKIQRGLQPEQTAIDGLGQLEKAAKQVWPDTRLVHDINHLRRAIDKVRVQFDGKAYQVMEAAEKMRKRHAKGPTRGTSQVRLDAMLKEDCLKEDAAIEKAEEVSQWVRQAQEALNVVNSETGEVQEKEVCQEKMKEVAEKFKGLGTTYSKIAAEYLCGLGQKIVSERVEYRKAMIEVASRREVEFSIVEKAAHLLQLHKQREGAEWPGTKEILWKKMGDVWVKLKEEEGGKETESLLIEVALQFQRILSASSSVEGANERLSAVVYPQKRASSGYLQLRAAYLNLQKIGEGKRKGYSPHELLTGEKIEDWLEKLGYGPKQHPTRSYKSLGWKRLVEPFEETWRKHWGLSKATGTPVPQEILQAVG